MLNDSEPAVPCIPRKTKANIFIYEIKSNAVIFYENDKIGIAAKSFKADGPCTGKKIEHFCTLDRFSKDTKQGFPRPVRGRSDTLIVRGRSKEFSTFLGAADNSQDFTKLKDSRAFLSLSKGRLQAQKRSSVPIANSPKQSLQRGLFVQLRR